MSDEAELPPHLDPRYQYRTGIDVLNQGLPALPGVLTHEMAVPVAFWKATSCAVVLFLRYSYVHFPGDDDGTFRPSVTLGRFYREAGRWAAHKRWTGTGWSHDPIAEPSRRTGPDWHRHRAHHRAAPDPSHDAHPPG